MTTENKLKLQNYIELIETELAKLNPITSDNQLQKNVIEAMNYSLSAGGKKIRPVLMMEFCRLCGGKAEDALYSACAIEMIHTFSLIHDDLPCMDDDDFRRGKPSCHVAFEEPIALLAGDALAILPFEIISGDKSLNPATAVRVISELSKAVGTAGMIGGQVIDIEHEGKQIGKDILMQMYSGKTSALIRAACRIGGIIGGADETQLGYISDYAENLGLAFQIIDDILDIVGSDEELGKPIGSDAEQGKCTFATLYGIEESAKIAEKLTNEALNILNKFDNNEFLIDLTKLLLTRKK